MCPRVGVCACVGARATNPLKPALFLVFNGFEILCSEFLESLITNPSLEFRNSKWRIQ